MSDFYEKNAVVLHELTKEAPKLWEALGLNDDIRKGWQEAAINDKLFAFGPSKLPLDVIESIQEDMDRMLELAVGWRKNDRHAHVKVLEDRIKDLEKALEEKSGEVKSLIKFLGEMNSKNDQDEIEIDFDKLY